MAIVLRIVNRKQSIDERIEVSEECEVSMGRGANNDYVLKDERCSTKHALLLLTLGEIHIQDLDSKNGTYLDNEKISKGRIYVGTQIIMGETKIMIDTSSMSDVKKKSYSKKNKYEDGRRHKDLSMVDKSVQFEMTNGNVEIDKNDLFNSGKRGLGLPGDKKKK